MFTYRAFPFLYLALLLGGWAFQPLEARTGPHLPHSLPQAAQQNLITYTLTWLPAGADGLPYGKRLKLTLTNLTRKTQDLEMKPGQVLRPSGGSGEPLLLTEHFRLSLPKGRQPREVLLYAMALQVEGKPSGEAVSYQIAEAAAGPLLGLAELLAAQNLQGQGAQTAVWVLTDGLPLTLVECADASSTDKLRKYLAAATRKPFIPYAPQSFFDNAKKVTGSFRYYLPQAANVSLELIGPSGNLVRTIFTEQARPLGENTERVELSGSELPPGAYLLRLKLGTKTVRETGFSL